MPVVTPHVSGIIVEATVCKIIPSLITKSEIDQIVISHLKNYKDGFIKNKIQYLDKASGQRIVFEYKSFNYTVIYRNTERYSDGNLIDVVLTLIVHPNCEKRAITFLNHVNDHIMTWCNDYVAFVQHSEILKCRRNTNLHTEQNNGE